MKKNEIKKGLIYVEVGMEALGVIDLNNKEARLNCRAYGDWITLYKVKFDEFYDLEKIKAKLVKKAEAYYTFLDS